MNHLHPSFHRFSMVISLPPCPHYLLPFCTCMLALFHSSIHSCLPGNYCTTPIPPLHWFSPLLLFISSLSHPLLLSHPSLLPPLYLTFAGLFLSSSVHIFCAVYVHNGHLCCSFLFHLFLFSSSHFSPPTSPPTRNPTEPHPTQCVLWGLRRH